METTFGGTGGNEGESRKPGCGVVLGVGRSLPEGPGASCPASRTTADRISAGGTEITTGELESNYIEAKPQVRILCISRPVLTIASRHGEYLVRRCLIVCVCFCTFYLHT